LKGLGATDGGTSTNPKPEPTGVRSIVEVKNSVNPNAEQIKGFFEPGAEGAIYMLNLLKFKDEAVYEDGRETNLSGAEAYALYGVAVSALIREVGGEAKFSAQVKRLMLGEVEELWDQAAIAMYPSRKAMLAMIQSPRYQEISVHRTAGLAGQLNIELVNPVGAWLANNG
jgi:uncharacterized protein (DUF1330 family)